MIVARGQQAPSAGKAAPRTGVLTRVLRAAGVKPNLITVFSAHQMGSCKMGTSAKTSVVAPDGQSWQVSGLYLADASVLPTSTGAPFGRWGKGLVCSKQPKTKTCKVATGSAGQSHACHCLQVRRLSYMLVHCWPLGDVQGEGNRMHGRSRPAFCAFLGHCQHSHCAAGVTQWQVWRQPCTWRGWHYSVELA